MKAGFYEMDITPAIGMERPSSYMKRYIESIHDPLKVRVAYIENQDDYVVFIGIDTCMVTPETVAKAKGIMLKLTGLKPDNILIAASHTHTGGPLFGFHPRHDFQDAPELIRRVAFDYSLNIDPGYEDFVVCQIVNAVKEAERQKEDAVLSFGSGKEEEVSFNRRFRMKNGKTVTHPGKGNPDIVEPAGPIDPEVGVVGAWRKDGTLLGCIVNFTCHGTTFNGSMVSAGWVGDMEQTIKGGLDAPDTTVVFLNGACGDVTQVNNLSMRENAGNEEASRFVGSRVGAEVIKVLVSAEKGRENRIATHSKTITIRKRVPSPESVDMALKKVRSMIDEPDTCDPEWLFAKERVLLDYDVRQEPKSTIHIQALQIGPAVFLTMPGEAFCQSGLNVKAESNFPLTWIVGYTGGAGYVPTEDAFTPEGGGYETVLTAFSCLEPCAATLIEQACIEISTVLKPEGLPAGSQLSEHGKPWSFGCLGPDLD